MIRSEVLTVSREDGEVQRAHIIRADTWDGVRFITPESEPETAFRHLVALYRDHHVFRYPFLYGRLVFFRCPDHITLPGTHLTEKRDRLIYAVNVLKKGMTVKKGRPSFSTEEAKLLYTALEAAGCIDIVCGNRRTTNILPVADDCGFLSSCAPEKGVVANLSFFLMDPYDCPTEYDHIGIPVGLRVRDGVAESMPQFKRPIFLVKKDGSVLITDDFEDTRIDPLIFEYKGKRIDLKRERVHVGPLCFNTAGSFILSGDRIVSGTKMRCKIPSSGFLAAFHDKTVASCSVGPGERIAMRGMSDILFGIQVGPAAVIDGEPQMGAPAHFYKIKKLISNILTLTVPYPPALYRCDPRKDRAPRMVLGADGEGKPMLVWLEGAAKACHTPGDDSCGATLREAAAFCAEYGMKNGIHLDGGGSAQILIDGKRELMISDRDPLTGKEMERAVPNGIIIA